MNRLVKQHGEVEDREPLHQGRGDPDQRVGEPDQKEARHCEKSELSEDDQEVTPRLAEVQSLQLVAWDGQSELLPQSRRVVRPELLPREGTRIVDSASRC